MQSDSTPHPTSRLFVAEQDASGGMWQGQLGAFQLPAKALVDEAGRLLAILQQELPSTPWRLTESESNYTLSLKWERGSDQRMLEIVVHSTRLGLHVWLYPHHLEADHGNRTWLSFWRAERALGPTCKGDLLVYRGERTHGDYTFTPLRYDPAVLKGIPRHEKADDSRSWFEYDVAAYVLASLYDIGMRA